MVQRYFTTFCLLAGLIASPVFSYAQDPEFDGQIVPPSFFTDPLISVAEADFVLDSIASLNDLNKIYQSFVFKDTEYDNAFDKLNIIAASDLYRYGQLRKVDFELNSKQSSSYSFFTKRRTPNTDSIAFLIIPGTGINQSSELFDLDRFYNAAIVRFLTELGDAFVYIKPNEDVLAYRNGNNKKLGPMSLYPHLIKNGTSYSVNYLIQVLAYEKYLKQKYKKLIVVGLSQGGQATLMTAQQSEPDGAVVSSGYSMYIAHVDYSNITQIVFPEALKYLNIDYIADVMSKQNTPYFFSWGRGEENYYWNQENLLHPTCDYLSAKGVTNFEYFTDFTGHQYPYAPIVNFANKIIAKPKYVVDDDRLCIGDSVLVTYKGGEARPNTYLVHMLPPSEGEEGPAVYSLDLTKDSTVLQSAELDTGSYYIGYENENGDFIYTTNRPLFNVYPNPVVHVSDDFRPCSNDGIAYMKLKFEGAAPFALKYTYGDLEHQSEGLRDSLGINFSNSGTLTGLFITDSMHCVSPPLADIEITTPGIDRFVLTHQQGTLFAEPGYTNYRWLVDDKDTVYTNGNFLIVNKSATYYALAEDSYGCLLKSDGIRLTVQERISFLWFDNRNLQIVVRSDDDNGKQPFHAAVFNLNGQEIRRVEFSSQNYTLNLSDLRPGLYIVKVTSKNGSDPSTFKLVKQ